jgi:hypothetical protein
MKTNTHGGARPGSGRKRKVGWQLCGFRLEIATFEQVKRLAKDREMSQSALVNQLLKSAIGPVQAPMQNE